MKLYELLDIAEATTREDLNEASLGRVYQHTIGEGSVSFAILTSWRYGKLQKDNVENFNRLIQQVKSAQLGFFKLTGHGQEEDRITKQIIPAKEPVLFIPNISLKLALKLANEYDQYGIIYHGEEVQNNFALELSNGTIDKYYTKFIPNKISQYYSIIKGKPFVFEAAPFGWMEGIFMGDKIKKRRIPGIDDVEDSVID